MDRVLGFEQPTDGRDSPRPDQDKSATRPEVAEPTRAGATNGTAATSDALVARAAAGDGRAWDLLVERHVGLLWAIARGHGLPAAAAAEVVHVGWLRLVEHLGDVRGGEPVDVWLATVTRQECLRRLRSMPEPGWSQGLDGAGPARADGPEDVVEVSRPAVNGAEVRRALHRLPPRQRLLLHVLGSAPATAPAAVSAAVDLPIERIEATRAEALHRLRTLLDRFGALPWQGRRPDRAASVRSAGDR